MNEPGPEAPAVVNLLVSEGRITSLAVSATLVDLSARRIVTLEEVGPKRFVVRIRPAADRSHLTPYELQVLRLVDARASGGSAPVEVLRQAAGETDTWLRTFGETVVRDAEAGGLVRRGWSRAEEIALVALGLVLGLAALALTLAHVGASDNTGGWFAAAVIVWLVVATARAGVRTVHLTAEGRNARARWLELRTQLASNPNFGEQPPAAVAIWGRVLAYGIALGVNREAGTTLAVAAPDPKSAWTRERGTWQLLRVRSPHRFGAGEPPRDVFLQGVVRLVAWAALGLVVFPVALSIVWDGVDYVLGKTSGLAASAIVALFAIIAAVVVIFISLRAFDGAVRARRAWWDLHHTELIEGPVIQVVDRQFAVDDGRAHALVGFTAPAGLVPRLGQRVRVSYTPKLHYVQQIIDLDAPKIAGEPNKKSTTDGAG